MKTIMSGITEIPIPDEQSEEEVVINTFSDNQQKEYEEALLNGFVGSLQEYLILRDFT